MTIARRRQEIRAMTNMTATFQCPAVSLTPPAWQLPLGKLNAHLVEFHPGPTSPRAQAKQTRKWLFDMTDTERIAFLSRSGVRQVKSTEPDPIEKSMKSQGVLQRGFWGTLYDNTLGALENALAEDETKPETVKPVARQRPAATGKLDDFLKDIEGNFRCFRQGKPCTVMGTESLDGKVILIGWAHDDEKGIRAIRDLLARHMRKKTDFLVAETTPSEFQQGTYRDRSCMGVAKERCIAGDLEGGSKITTAAADKAGAVAAKLAHRLDPNAAAEIARKYAGEISVYKILNACQGVIASKYKSLSPKQIKALNGLDQEYVDAINEMNEATTLEMRARNRHMRQVVMDNVPNGSGTLFVVLGGLHVDYLARGLETNGSVLELYPESAYGTIQQSMQSVRRSE
jgi:hypothetical protein